MRLLGAKTANWIIAASIHGLKCCKQYSVDKITMQIFDTIKDPVDADINISPGCI